jgi:hypothetical protein
MAIFTMLILPIHEHGRSFKLLMSSLISVFSSLSFSLKRYFGAGGQWLTPIILATQEAEIRMIAV